MLVWDTRDRLRSGHLDLMLAPNVLDTQDLEVVSSQVLYTDHLVAAVWKGNDSYGDSLDEEQFFAANHVDFNPHLSGSRTSTTHHFLADNALKVRFTAEFSTQMTMIHALRHADVMAVVPSKLVELAGEEAEVKALKLPFETPEFNVCILWNRGFDNNPEHQWFRGLVEDLAGNL